MSSSPNLQIFETGSGLDFFIVNGVELSTRENWMNSGICFQNTALDEHFSLKKK